MNEGRAASYAGIAEASRNLANGHDGHDREGCGEGDVGGDNDGFKKHRILRKELKITVRLDAKLNKKPVLLLWPTT